MPHQSDTRRHASDVSTVIAFGRGLAWGEWGRDALRPTDVYHLIADQPGFFHLQQLQFVFGILNFGNAGCGGNPLRSR